ncbi:redoxin domain-containing protein [Algoriphagus aestuariicola]|jgi:thiol-disulfide isomerase/thioredoxin|uniref:Redoxin domain-containing protein n=1 Tax=Algoriphagus aestuariicola TaxID=1852016 RepID=A0ABS3BRA5_9BACT|nr:redoxin domain-containing protein [Algoriphagus aestuariicola]MBN7801620.1 redoxin domain-containing protein [Algoriphagus aestuariicola]
MKNPATAFLLFISLTFSALAQNFAELSAVDAVSGSSKTLGSMVSGKGIVLVFHSLNCPFTKMYEGRLKALKSTFQNQGIGFALVNPEVGTTEADQLPLRNHIDQSGLNMAYLIDENQVWAKQFSITKIPEVIVLVKGQNGLEVAYRGAIDNNPQAETAVSEKHLERALNQILRGETSTPAQVRAVGCNLRTY